MKLTKLKLDYEQARKKCRTSPLVSFIQGGQDVFTLMPDTTSHNFKSELRNQTRLLGAYPGVVVTLHEDAYRVGHDIKSALISSGILDKNHPGLWSYSLINSPAENTSQENLIHVHSV